MIPDGLTPGEHVVVAMMTCHPLQLMPTLFLPVAYATKYGKEAYECVTQRHEMLCLLRNLRDELSSETENAIRMCNPIVAKVLIQNGFTRNIPLQRELGFIFNIPDWAPYHHWCAEYQWLDTLYGFLKCYAGLNQLCVQSRMLWTNPNRTI